MVRKTQSAGHDLVRVVNSVRRLFHRMGNAWNGLHKDLGVSARMRAVMESLQESDKSVPQISREKEVTRQHIQSIINELLDAELIDKVDNPAHKRSALLTLTGRGRRVFRQISEREAKLFPAIADHLRTLDLASTAATLETLLEFFDSDEFTKIARKSLRRSKGKQG